MKASDIELLEKDGFISADQRKSILGHLQARTAKEMPPPQRVLVFMLAAVAAALIIVGALLQAVSHWQSISPIMKMCSTMLIMAAAWVGSFILRNRKPLVAEGLGLIGAGMWGVNIVTHNALFEVDIPWVESFFLFVIGVLPIPFLVRQRVLVGVVAASTLILLCGMYATPVSSWLSMVEVAPGTWYMLVMALLLIWWMVGEKFRGTYGVGMNYYWISFPTYALFLCIIQYALLYANAPRETDSGCWLFVAAVALSIPLLKPKTTGWLLWICATVSSFALIPLGVLLRYIPEYSEVVGMLIGVTFSAIFMVIGVRAGRYAWVYVSVVMMVFVAFDVLVHIRRSFSDSGLFLMALGLAILVFAFLLEKQRRFLVNKIKQKNLPPKA